MLANMNLGQDQNILSGHSISPPAFAEVNHSLDARYRGSEEIMSEREPEYDFEKETFGTEPEADAFIDGLTYGDEPQYVVDHVEPTDSGLFIVVFRDKYAEPY
jgi:hypothetical protein